MASAKSASPSVFQIRVQTPLPVIDGSAVKAALSQFEEGLTKGALITVDLAKAGVHLLPLDNGD